MPDPEVEAAYPSTYTQWTGLRDYLRGQYNPDRKRHLAALAYVAAMVAQESAYIGMKQTKESEAQAR